MNQTYLFETDNEIAQKRRMMREWAMLFRSNVKWANEHCRYNEHLKQRWLIEAGRKLESAVRYRNEILSLARK